VAAPAVRRRRRASARLPGSVDPVPASPSRPAQHHTPHRTDRRDQPPLSPRFPLLAGGEFLWSPL